MRVPPAQACTRSVQYSFDRSQTPMADSLRAGGRPSLITHGPASERRRPQAASARARVTVPALAAGLFLVPHEDAYQCVRTCPGARGWGEAWAAGAVPSSCTEMAPHVVGCAETRESRTCHVCGALDCAAQSSAVPITVGYMSLQVILVGWGPLESARHAAPAVARPYGRLGPSEQPSRGPPIAPVVGLEPCCFAVL
jgi:hypothetical protein